MKTYTLQSPKQIAERVVSKMFGGEGSGNYGHEGLDNVHGGSSKGSGVSKSKISSKKVEVGSTTKIKKARNYFDKFEQKEFDEIKIQVTKLGNRYGTMRGDILYIDSDTVENEHPVFISVIIKHELMHRELTKKKVPSANQEWQVRNRMRFWISTIKTEGDSIAKEALKKVWDVMKEE